MPKSDPTTPTTSKGLRSGKPYQDVIDRRTITKQRNTKRTRLPSPIPRSRIETPQNKELQSQEIPSSSSRKYSEVLRTPTTSGERTTSNPIERINALIEQAHAAVRQQTNRVSPITVTYHQSQKSYEVRNSENSTQSESSPSNNQSTTIMDLDEVTALINQRVAEALQRANDEHAAQQTAKDAELARLRLDNDLLVDRVRNPSPTRALSSALSGIGIVAANAITAEKPKFKEGHTPPEEFLKDVEEARDKVAKRPFTIPPLRASGREGYGKKAVATQEGQQAMGRGNNFRFHIQGRWRGGSRRGESDRGRMGRGHMQRGGFQHYGNGNRRPYGVGVYPTRGRGENRGGDQQNGNNRGNNRAMSSRGRAFDREMSDFKPKPLETLLDQLKTIPKDLKRHIEWVKNNIRKMQKANKTYYDKKHIPHPFKSGDKVMIRNHARSDKTAHKIQKLLRKWIGPFLLGAQAEDNDVTFEILTIPEFRRVGRRHVSDLRPYVERRTIRRRLVTSPNVDNVDNADEPRDVSENQEEPARTSRRMSRQVGCKKESKFQKERRELDEKYGETTHPFHVTYPGYPYFKEFIQRINAKEFFPRLNNSHFVRIKEFNLPTDYLKSEERYVNGHEDAKNTIRVDTFKTLVDMVTHLNQHKRFATDMEGGAVQGYRGSHPALIQFSTTECDFYVQPLMIWENMDLLRPIMEHPDKVKLMFGCQNDLMWWRRYFDIDPYPVVDAQAVYQAIYGGNPIKLTRFVDSYLPGTTMDKSLTNFDWARRELEPEAIKYALEDSRFLLQAWDNFAMDIDDAFEKKAVEIQGALIKVMIDGSKPFAPTKHPSLEKLKVSREEESQDFFYALWNWRDELARKRDIAPKDILSDRSIVKQANEFRGFHELPMRQLFENRFTNRQDVEELRELVKSFMNARTKKIGPATDEPNELDTLDLQLHADLEGLAELEIKPKANCQSVDRADDWENWETPMDVDNPPPKTKVQTETVPHCDANDQIVDWADDDWDELMAVEVCLKAWDPVCTTPPIVETNSRTSSPQTTTSTPKSSMKSVVTVVQHNDKPTATAKVVTREVTDQQDGDMRVRLQATTTSNEVSSRAETTATVHPVVIFKDHIPNEDRKQFEKLSEKISWALREQEMRSEGIVCTIVQQPQILPTGILPIFPSVPVVPMDIEPPEPNALIQQQVAERPSPQRHLRPCFTCYEMGHVKQHCPHFKVPVTDELRAQFKLNKQRYMDENPDYKMAELQRKAVNKVMNRARKLDPLHQDILLHRIQQGRVQKGGALHGEDHRRW
ncbi:unnamed protein product [Orchesella dallaii]|uniref:CCHC-type domain-containing protein n=1 Tax=Orchesella dallaii TaxID=48710 RepID=A0ABP1RUT7_9HEXA